MREGIDNWMETILSKFDYERNVYLLSFMISSANENISILQEITFPLRNCFRCTYFAPCENEIKYGQRYSSIPHYLQ